MKIVEKNPRVSIVVANHNGKRYLERCFSSLRKLDYARSRLQVIMVDNCSTDGSDRFVKKEFPGVRVLHNDVNNYAKANNIGIKASDGDFTAFLNNDTYVDKNWLSELLKVFRTDQKIGCAGSKVLLPDGRFQSAGHYEFPNFYWGDRGFREPNLGQYDNVKEVSSLSASSVLFRRKCIEDVGYLDEDFVMYLEDVDLFIRCRNKGWKLIYAPKSIVYHVFHGTSDERLAEEYVERNRLLLIAKHFPDKLGDALIGNGYYVNKNKGAFYKVMPEVISKLVVTHGTKVARCVIPGLFANIEKITDYSKDKGMQIITDERDHLKGVVEKLIEEKDRSINDISTRITKELQEKDLTIGEIKNQKQQSELLLKQHIDNIASEKQGLFQKLNEISIKIASAENLVQEKTREIEEKSRALKDTLGTLSEREAVIHQLNKQVQELAIIKNRLEVAVEEKTKILEKESIMLDEFSNRKERELEDKQFIIREMITENTKLKFIEIEKIKEINALDSKLKESISEKQRLEQLITDTNKTLTDRDASIADLNANLSALSSEKQRLEQSISDINKALSERDSLVQDLNVKVSSLGSERNNLEQLIRDTNNTLAERDKCISDLNVNLSVLSSEKQRLGQIIEEKNRLITDKEALVKDLSDNSVLLASEKQRLEQLMLDANKTISDRDVLIAELYKNIAILNSHKERMGQLIKEGKEVIAERDTYIADSNDRITALSFEKKKSEEEIIKLCSQISALEVDLNKIRESLNLSMLQKDELNRLLMISHENEQLLTKKIQDMFNSETYRFIVRPIWRILDFLKCLGISRKEFDISTFKIIYRRLLLISIVTVFVVFIVFPMKVKKLFMR